MGKVELSQRSRAVAGVSGRARPRFPCCSSGGLVSGQVTLRLQPVGGTLEFMGGVLRGGDSERDPERGQQRAGD